MKPLVAIFAVCALPLSAQQLTYSAGWRLFDAGKATMQLGTHEALIRVETQGVVGKLHPVNDRYQSNYTDGFCAVSSLMHAEEAGDQTETAVTFDSGMAHRVETDLKLHEKKTAEISTPACVHDLVSGLMKMRELKLKPGAEAMVPLSDGKKSIQARVAAMGVEQVKTPAGQFRAIRHEVFLYNGAFFRKKGRLFVWISDDERRLPVQFRVELAFYIGDITVTLDSINPSVASTAEAILR